MVTGLTHGVTFGNYHSIQDWGIYLAERPVVSSPEVRTNYIEIAGMDGTLDFSEALTGRASYSDRELSCKFTLLPPRERWNSVVSKILRQVHGKKMKIILDEEPDFYYYGRVIVGSPSSDKVETLPISAIIQPYKYSVQNTAEQWKWDPFNFETGIITGYSDITVSGSKSVSVIGSFAPTFPVITCSSSMTMTCMGKSYSLSAGQNSLESLIIPENGTTMVFSGSGTVSIAYEVGEF